MEDYKYKTIYIDEDDHITSIKVLKDKIYIRFEIGTVEEISTINCKEVVIKLETKLYQEY